MSGNHDTDCNDGLQSLSRLLGHALKPLLTGFVLTANATFVTFDLQAQVQAETPSDHPRSALRKSAAPSSLGLQNESKDCCPTLMTHHSGALQRHELHLDPMPSLPMGLVRTTCEVSLVADWHAWA